MSGTCVTRPGLRTEDPLYNMTVSNNPLSCFQNAEGWRTNREREKRKGRVLLTHNNNGSLVVQYDSIAFHGSCARLDNIGELLVKRIGESYMSYDTALEKGKRADALGAVNGLVGDDKVHGLDLLLQRADSRKGDDAADADAAESRNIGPVGHLVRRELVVQAMAREEGNVDVAVGQDMDGRRGLAPWRVGVEGSDGCIALELTETSATNDGNVDRLYRRK